jgi:hypothetical protein
MIDKRYEEVIKQQKHDQWAKIYISKQMN